jgi:hypothetical protein
MFSSRTINVLLMASTLFVVLAFPVAYLLHENNFALIQNAAASIGVMGALVNLFSWSMKLTAYLSRRRAAAKSVADEAIAKTTSSGSLARESERLLREHGL